MRKNLLGMALLLVVVAIGSLAPVYSAEEEMVALVDKIKPSVVTILVFNEKDKIVSQGSGFFISDNRIVTNRHVIENAHHASIKTALGGSFPVKGILAEDELKDLAVLSVKVPKNQYKPLTLSKSLPKEGREIVVIGSPLGLEHTVSNGIVSAIRDLPGFGEIIQITAPVSPGSSGSVVVDKSGVVIGVVVSQFSAGQNLNFSIPASQIQKLKIGRVQTLSAWSKSKPALSNEKVKQEIDSGASAILKQDYTEAIIHLKNVIELDSNNAFAYYCLGVAYGELRQDEKALESYKQAIRLNPDFSHDHVNLGNAYSRLGQYEKALESYKQAIRIQPDDAGAHYNLGHMYNNLKQYEKALESYKQAIRIQPDYAKAHCGLGYAYAGLKQYEKALESYKQAIRLNPDDAEAHFNLGVTYTRLGQYEKVLESYKQFIRIQPDYAKAHFNLGVTYWILKRNGEALDEYKILKNIDSEQANKLFNLIYK
jgi:tetratricopeptide (TPR) repeat protein